ncbi:uncharacterized protein LOC118732834, partial [Rhagoletis pomonella]|uniref:uncharacterized protein LOC118732834 n=1 Tax=Rhagoletis pomonella TaxID=28610 RepID=UPI00177D6A93
MLSSNTTPSRGADMKLSGESVSAEQLMQTWEQKLKKHEDNIIKHINEMWEQKLKAHEANIIKHVNESLQTIENRVMQRMSELTGELANTKERLDKIEQRMTGVEYVHTELALLKTNVDALREQVEDLGEKAVSTDIVMHGIPYSSDENLKEIFTKLCGVINLETPGISQAGDDDDDDD